MRRPGTRVVTGGQALLGLATVVGARPLAATVRGRAPRALPVVIGVLGARQVAQAALVYTVDDPVMLRAGAAVDVLHAASLIPVIARVPRLRALALASAVSAAASAVAGLVVAE